MDIKITKAELDPDGRHLLVYRTYDEGTPNERTSINRMPKEILSLRAAEYNLEPEHPDVLDMILLEPFIDMPGLHPLVTAATIVDAHAEVMRHIEAVKQEHGAPAGRMRTLFHAAESSTSSDGLKQAKALLLEHVDPTTVAATKYFRDVGRDRHARGMNSKKSHGQRLQDVMKSRLEAEASERKSRENRTALGTAPS